MESKTKSLAYILSLIYLLLLTWVVLFKLQFSIGALDRVRSLNLIPFYYEREIGNTFHLREVFENVLIFVPMGIYLQMLLPKGNFGAKIVSIIAVSLLMEVTQYALSIGRSDITDMLTNTVGGLLGLALYSAVNIILGSRRKADGLFIAASSIASTLAVALLLLVFLGNM